MQKLSTGEDATLGNYKARWARLFGEDSPAVAFLDRKIAGSPNGENEEVLADEGQMPQLLNSIME